MTWSVLREISYSTLRQIEMDTEVFDERVTVKVREVLKESQQQLLQEMNSLIQKISDQNSSSNEEKLVKISSLVATGERAKFKKKGNEEQYKINSKVMLKLDEAEQSIDAMNTKKTKEKVVEGKAE